MEKNELINDIRISIQDAHSIMKVLEHLACIGDDCSKDDYSGPFRATCPDFESHHSGV